MKTLFKTIRFICICCIIQAFQPTFSQIKGRIANWEDNKRAAVSLTFDDWLPEHPLTAIPELN